MTAHLTEEEQLEALKRWWRENGKATAVGVVLALAGYFGWEGWQNHRQAQAEAASAIYMDLMVATSLAPGEILDEEQRATALHLVGQLKDEYSGTLYALQAAMLAAKLAVEGGELDKATEELRWVLEQNPEKAVELMARARLARVLAAQEHYDEALQTLEGVTAETYAAVYEELRGDIYLAQDKKQEARGAYQQALAKLLPEQGARRNLLQMKLNDLSLATAPVEKPVEKPVDAPENAEGEDA